MQPVIVADDGIVRFQGNQIVRHLLHASNLNLCDMETMGFSQADWEQLMQLLGFSVSGFGDLNCASAETIAAADGAAEKLTSRT